MPNGRKVQFDTFRFVRLASKLVVLSLFEACNKPWAGCIIDSHLSSPSGEVAGLIHD